MSADYMSKAVADRQFEIGDEEPTMPTCAHCDRADLPLADYNQGYTPEPLLLCDDCTQQEAERVNERQQQNPWRYS